MLASLMLSACGGDDDKLQVGSLRLIGHEVLPRRTEFQGTVSGIDYDASNRRYVLISDDRTTTESANPPRLYFATLNFDAAGFSGVQFESTVKLLQPDCSVYPKVPDARVADPESVRVDPGNGNLVWASEGDRALTAVPPRVIDPFVREIAVDGRHVREYILPAMFKMSSSDIGPRGNLVFEGLSFTPNGRQLAVLMEGPLFQDGPAPTLAAGANGRIGLFDRASAAATAQYVYPIERVQATPVPDNVRTAPGQRQPEPGGRRRRQLPDGRLGDRPQPDPDVRGPAIALPMAAYPWFATLAGRWRCFHTPSARPISSIDRDVGSGTEAGGLPKPGDAFQKSFPESPIS